jgi:CheY-like chemotaxis protein
MMPVGARRLLLVEDEPLLRAAAAEAFRDAGWSVVEVSTAEDAVACLQIGYQVDVVFTDIRLAGRLSGWDVAEHFRAAHVGMPIVYASGNAADRSRRVENSVFFDKPYEVADVVAVCFKAVGGSL